MFHNCPVQCSTTALCNAPQLHAPTRPTAARAICVHPLLKKKPPSCTNPAHSCRSNMRPPALQKKNPHAPTRLTAAEAICVHPPFKKPLCTLMNGCSAHLVDSAAPTVTAASIVLAIDAASIVSIEQRTKNKNKEQGQRTRTKNKNKEQ
jgi:hypothetical protein